MISKISCKIKSRIGNRFPLNILTVPTHEGYQSMLAETGHNFYMLRGEGLKTWDFHTRQLPKNHYIYNLDYNSFRGSESFDLILCQNRIQQWDILSYLSERLGLPIVVLDHTEPPPGLTPEQFNALKFRVGDENVYITEHNKKTWCNLAGTVIRHGIDTDTFQGWTGKSEDGISVVNRFPERDIFCGWTIWKIISENSDAKINLIGDNPGLSQSVASTAELAGALADHRFFLNTSQLSPIPLSLMEAMAVGMPIVSTAKQEIPSVIQHEYNGLLSNDPFELIEFCNRLKQDYEYAKYLGDNARKTILKKYNLQNFINNWNNVFYNAFRKLT